MVVGPLMRHISDGDVKMIILMFKSIYNNTFGFNENGWFIKSEIVCKHPLIITQELIHMGKKL